MNPKPLPATVIRRAIRAALRQVRVMLPGRIVSYDATTCQADVQPLIMEAQTQPDGSTIVERLPVVTHCPVVFCGGGGARLTFPIAVGDTCLLMFSSSSLDQWLAVGGEVDPADDRRQHISDGIALVGINDFAHATPAHATATVLTGNDVRLGDANGGAIAKNADLSSLVNVLKTWTPVSGDGGAALKTAVIAAFPSLPAGTTKVKAT